MGVPAAPSRAAYARVRQQGPWGALQGRPGEGAPKGRWGPQGGHHRMGVPQPPKQRRAMPRHVSQQSQWEALQGNSKGGH
eukprot:7870969-Alexandrium_andersonii.AAC.1